jgi:hypothetical protein
MCVSSACTIKSQVLLILNPPLRSETSGHLTDEHDTKIMADQLSNAVTQPKIGNLLERSVRCCMESPINDSCRREMDIGFCRLCLGRVMRGVPSWTFTSSFGSDSNIE